jgi:hypothetical protein
MAADEHGRKDTVDDLIVADDDTSDLFADCGEPFAELLGLFLHRLSDVGHGQGLSIKKGGVSGEISSGMSQFWFFFALRLASRSLEV